MPVRTALEVGAKKAFAVALDCPGWARAGKGEEAALEALVSYLPRYAVVTREAGQPPPEDDLEVVERLPGDGSTDFGVPGKPASTDTEPLTAAEADRQADLLAAAWRVFDRVAAGAPAELRKGPRGGGRDRDKIVAHVMDAEVGYKRRLALKGPSVDPSDPAAVDAHREEILEVLRDAREGVPLKEKGWLPRYAFRRFTWHVLDHAWEIEDRAQP